MQSLLLRTITSSLRILNDKLSTKFMPMNKYCSLVYGDSYSEFCRMTEQNLLYKPNYASIITDRDATVIKQVCEKCFRIKEAMAFSTKILFIEVLIF